MGFAKSLPSVSSGFNFSFCENLLSAMAPWDLSLTGVAGAKGAEGAEGLERLEGVQGGGSSACSTTELPVGGST